MEILGKKLLSSKEASKRYGMSEEWFNKRRYKDLEPKYIKITERGRVYYPQIETDEWFRKRIQINEGA